MARSFGKTVLVLLAALALAAAFNEAASVESSRADVLEPLSGQESSVVGLANGSAEQELDDILSAEPGESGATEAQRQDQRWLDAAASADQEQQDSNIENAKLELSPLDLAAAAGHHHHHGHYVSGKMSMGAHSGHKGAFGWHAKFPVGGKGRR